MAGPVYDSQGRLIGNPMAGNPAQFPMMPFGGAGIQVFGPHSLPGIGFDVFNPLFSASQFGSDRPPPPPMPMAPPPPGPQYDRQGRLINGGQMASGMSGAPSYKPGPAPRPASQLPGNRVPTPKYDSNGRLINQEELESGATDRPPPPPTPGPAPAPQRPSGPGPKYDEQGRMVNSDDVMGGMTGAPAGPPSAPQGPPPQAPPPSAGYPGGWGGLIGAVAGSVPGVGSLLSGVDAGPGQEEARKKAAEYLAWMQANSPFTPGPGASDRPPPPPMPQGPSQPGGAGSGEGGSTPPYPPLSGQGSQGSMPGGDETPQAPGSSPGATGGVSPPGAPGPGGGQGPFSPPQTGSPFGGGGIPGMPPGAGGAPGGSGPSVPGTPGSAPGGGMPSGGAGGGSGPSGGGTGSSGGDAAGDSPRQPGPMPEDWYDPTNPFSGASDGWWGNVGPVPPDDGGASGGSGGGGGSGGPPRNDPKPQTGGPGARQPTWQDILGPNMGIPPGQTYPGGYAGGLPGMGGGYNTAPNLPGPGSSGTGDQGKEFLKGTIDEFQRAQDSANAANNQRYQQGLDILSGMNRQQDQLLGGLSGLYGQRNTDFGTGMNNVVGAQQGILDDWLRRSGLIGQGYDALNQRVMDRTDLMGYQRANEINDAFTRQGAQADQDMINRGLSNTTIRPSVMRGIENDRERSLTGLREDVNNQLNQLDMGTTNPALQFGERAGQFASGLGGNVAGTMQQGLQGLAGLQGEGLQFGERANQYQQQTGNNVVNWIGNRNDVGPDFNTLAQLALGVGASGFGYGAMPSLPAGSTGFPTGVPSPSLPYYQSPPQQSNQPPSRAGGTAYTPGITGGPSQMRPLSNTKPYATLF